MATESANLTEDDEERETWLQWFLGANILRALMIGAIIGVVEVVVVIGNPLEIRRTARWSDFTWDKVDAFKDYMRERVGLETYHDQMVRQMREDREQWIRHQLQSQARVHSR